jgi:hypothetical protein
MSAAPSSPVEYLTADQEDVLGIQQLGTLLVAVGMVALGVLGLLGALSPGPVLITGLFIVSVLLAFSIGKTAAGQ